MRRSLACLFCVFSLYTAAAACAADDAPDLWSGRYALSWVAAPSRPANALEISRAPDANPADLVESYRQDLARWALTDPREPAGKARLKRFIDDEYREWGWSQMHAAGAIQCLHASRLFICRTAPGTTVKFGPTGPQQEELVASTGLFGIALHSGAFELKKE
jgi:hypothetical protein